ncbi:beta-ketoacyl synthase N-terminal-like domain-containing protein [Streptodolium elevatio]|uniref:Beta-ketoacyl synthase N-terminal-like domain-containing protein n=1 Tax=Streptodolium elevatio TaxID=3157996 RepID=A0ABV3DMV4_9ACTN
MSPGATRIRVTGLGLTAPGVDRPDRALEIQPDAPAGWFDTATALPGRGYRRLPPGALYLLAAARAAWADRGPWIAAVPAASRGAVVGTNNVGASLIEEFDRTIIDLGAAELSPARAPYMAMSMFAARLAPEHELRAFDLTTNSPAVAGLDALQAAARALAAGRASVVLAGAVEEPPAPVQRLDHPRGSRADGADPGAAFDAGAAVLVCEPAEESADGGFGYGHCSVRSAFLPEQDSDTVSAVLDALWDELADEGPPPARIDTVLDDSATGRAVAAWLGRRVTRGSITAVPTAPGGGCLTPVRRVLGRLATPGENPARTAVLAASAHGHISIADVTPTRQALTSRHTL